MDNSTNTSAGGHIRGSVFGGAEEGAVWGHTEVHIAGGTIGKPLTLCTKNYRQLFHICKFGSIYAHRIVTECHCSRSEPHFTKLLRIVTIAF